ncbi:high affinity cAMP-specific and IBMX-insensitive 3',5'-cyclic phosphodiesterase 8B [Platysternon megacephalum]|uniref:High affinity cAMP-specific and IBMX-insensitive 3',5'-cyclic phosphodiesterase 8B n=1 Tax=Platysternon megacephalum TaxID=55544 RepID=A0A4D9EYC3_9SAUR|nr:high affinity cAMP-specific and IBMX-insensitive 3',5'-cyclic phosphodiesterase 8B [Platysternon megacephalum]
MHPLLSSSSSSSQRWLLENLAVLFLLDYGAPLSDKNMDLIGIIQYPWKPCSIRLALSCSSVTACSRLMPLLLRPGFHAQVHLVGQYSNFKCLSFNLLPSSIIPFHPTICVIFFCLKSLYCCSLLHSMTNYPSSHIFSAQKCAITQSHGIITCCALYFLTVHSSVSLYFLLPFVITKINHFILPKL